jgi:hypothetical protein
MQIIWRRLDLPGHDACLLEQAEAGWRLAGTAVYQMDGEPACLSYEVSCDLAWRSLGGRVHGWIGARSLELRIERQERSGWSLNGQAAPQVAACLDLDLGFTPATNLLPLRRLALALGQGAAAPAAWLDLASGTLATLEQRYERLTATQYWYSAPRFDYTALLEVDPGGFILQYPGLWAAEREPSSADAG